jgi:protein-disulfide isomerase
MKQVQETYGDKVRIVFKHFPLPFHKDAPLASQASMAAYEQGKFWEYHDVLFANQRALKREDLEKYAQQLGLDMAKFKGALDSEKFKSRVEADAKQVSGIGTPTFYINGRQLVGAQPFDAFKTTIDEELAKKGAGGGTAVAPAGGGKLELAAPPGGKRRLRRVPVAR